MYMLITKPFIKIVKDPLCQKKTPIEMSRLQLTTEGVSGNNILHLILLFFGVNIACHKQSFMSNLQVLFQVPHSLITLTWLHWSPRSFGMSHTTARAISCFAVTASPWSSG